MLADASSSSVAEAIKGGILEEKMNGLICTVCKTSMNGISSAESHLQGAKHGKEVKKFYIQAAAKLNSSCDTADSSSIDVLAAIKNGQVLSENVCNQLQLTCVSCKKSCTGEVPMSQHLASETHAKKIEQEALKARFSPHKELPSMTSSSKITKQFNLVPSAGMLSMQVVVEAINSGLVLSEIVGNQVRLTCVPCNKPCTGEVPMSQHLSSDVHARRMKKEDLSLRLSPNKEASVTAITPSTNTTVQFDSAMPVQGNEVAKAVVKGIVIPVKHDENHLQCLVCDIYCTGRDSMREHLMGKSHIKKNKNKSFLLLEQSVTKTEVKVETSPIPLASSTPIIKTGTANFIPPPQQFRDSPEVQHTAFQEMKYEELGDNLEEDVPVSSIRRKLDQIPSGELIKDICIYEPGESLSDLFD